MFGALYFGQGYLGLIHIETTPTGLPTFYTDKYTQQSTAYTDKYTPQNTVYTDKYTYP